MARRRKNGADEAMDEAREHLNGEDAEERVPAHNSAARAAIIRETCETIEEFDRQIAGIKAERKAVIETRIVADLGMKAKHFNSAYKLYQMTQEGRDELHDVIREVYRAHDIGFQGNWLDIDDEQVGADGHPAA